MEKTSWPTKEELFKYTVIVVSTVIFFLVFFLCLRFRNYSIRKIYYLVRGVKTCLKEVGAKRWYTVHTYSGYENKVKKEFRKKE